mgnify:CR=1 FL=1|jgi:predicted DCC family thiol-disulfide oxidoreductase YuxK
MCNKWAKFIIENDKSESIFVSGSNSTTSREIIKENKLKDLVDKTVILISDNNVYLYSDAVIKTATLMKGIIQFVSIGKIIPLKVRNYLYDLIAKRRKKLSWNACKLDEVYSKHERIIY